MKATVLIAGEVTHQVYQIVATQLESGHVAFWIRTRYAFCDPHDSHEEAFSSADVCVTYEPMPSGWDVRSWAASSMTHGAVNDIRNYDCEDENGEASFYYETAERLNRLAKEVFKCR